MKVISLLILLPLLLFSLSFTSANNNITQILASHPEYSTFSKLCTQTGVASQIFSRSTITVLAVQNSVLDPILQKSSYSAAALYDIISYHVLLDYFDIAKFKDITNGTTLTTTLYQASGQATGNEGFVNVTSKGNSIRLGKAEHNALLTAVVENQLYKAPYNISVVSISAVLMPVGIGAPAPAPALVNFTEILIQGKNYNTFLSLIKSTGVDALLTKHATPPGLTIFAPDDAAFKKLPAGSLGKLTSADQVALLEFHCLGNYYSTQELSALTSSQQTLASGSGGGTYEYTSITLSKGGDTIINTGFNKVTLGPTLYSQEPLGLYGVSTVLLPTDIYGLPPSAAPSPAPMMSPTPAPVPVSVPSSAPTPGPVSGPAYSPPAPPPSSLSESAGPKASDNASNPSVHLNLIMMSAFVHLTLAFLIFL